LLFVPLAVGAGNAVASDEPVRTIQIPFGLEKNLSAVALRAKQGVSSRVIRIP
jgi:hypothetical protein